MVKDGYKFAAAPFLLGAIALAFRWNWLGGVLIFLGLFVLFFFRDPERTPPSDPATIVSPADGRVMAVVEETLRGNPGRRISVFLSVFNVHVNRSPIRGMVEDVEYRKGQFIAAYKESSSENNEQNALTIGDTLGKKLKVVQIAGVLARRIVCRVKRGDALEAGERFGIIMFGSRVDVLLPIGARLEVGEGQRVTGGETILARSA